MRTPCTLYRTTDKFLSFLTTSVGDARASGEINRHVVQWKTRIFSSSGGVSGGSPSPVEGARLAA